MKNACFGCLRIFEFSSICTALDTYIKVTSYIQVLNSITSQPKDLETRELKGLYRTCLFLKALISAAVGLLAVIYISLSICSWTTDIHVMMFVSENPE